MRVKGQTLAHPNVAIAVREEILALAGITKIELADRVRRAFDKLTDKLDAKETKFFSHEGEVVETREVEAHGVQMQASEKLIDFAAAMPSRTSVQSGGSGKTQIAVVFVDPSPRVVHDRSIVDVPQ